MSITEEKIKEVLSKVIEPDLKKDIVELDLVSIILIETNKISLTVKVSNPAMHSRRRMQEACEFNLQQAFGKEVILEVTVEGMAKDRSPEHRKILPGIKNIVAVASGKGGVGKSTITANIAAGLAKKGHKVGLVDADIYGPSIPIMFDCVKAKPTGVEVDGKQLIKPVENYGVKMLSIGFFADTSQAVAWRGPMASRALTQMFKDTDWGDLDYLLIDVPPGTGDIHLQLVQSVPLTGVVIVSTPQEIALADAKKGVSMFQMDSINVPVLGIVENMAYFTPEELPENRYYIFGRDGAKNLANQLDVPLLGQIPIVQSIRESADVGRPAVLQDNTPTSDAFNELIDNVVERVEWRNNTLEPTKMVKLES